METCNPSSQQAGAGNPLAIIVIPVKADAAYNAISTATIFPHCLTLRVLLLVLIYVLTNVGVMVVIPFQMRLSMVLVSKMVLLLQVYLMTHTTLLLLVPTVNIWLKLPIK